MLTEDELTAALRTEGSVRRAAKKLEVSPMQVVYWLKKYRIQQHWVDEDGKVVA